MFVIYKDATGYCVTPVDNYNAIIRDARKIHKMYDFASASEIVKYFCDYCGYTASDFCEVVQK